MNSTPSPPAPPHAVYMVSRSVCSVCSDLVVVWWHRHFVPCPRQHPSGTESQPVPGDLGRGDCFQSPQRPMNSFRKHLWGLAWGCEILEINPDKNNKIKSLELSKAVNLAKFNARVKAIKIKTGNSSLPPSLHSCANASKFPRQNCWIKGNTFINFSNQFC